jgi:hypothetical protein
MPPVRGAVVARDNRCYCRDGGGAVVSYGKDVKLLEVHLKLRMTSYL